VTDHGFHVAYNELEEGNFCLLDYGNMVETNCILLVECISKTNPDSLQFLARHYSPNSVAGKWRDLIKPATKNYFLSWKATATTELLFQHNITVSNFVPLPSRVKGGKKKALNQDDVNSETQSKQGGKRNQPWQRTVLIRSEIS